MEYLYEQATSFAEDFSGNSKLKVSHTKVHAPTPNKKAEKSKEKLTLPAFHLFDYRFSHEKDNKVLASVFDNKALESNGELAKLKHGWHGLVVVNAYQYKQMWSYLGQKGLLNELGHSVEIFLPYNSFMREYTNAKTDEQKAILHKFDEIFIKTVHAENKGTGGLLLMSFDNWKSLKDAYAKASSGSSFSDTDGSEEFERDNFDANQAAKQNTASTVPVMGRYKVTEDWDGLVKGEVVEGAPDPNMPSFIRVMKGGEKRALALGFQIEKVPDNTPLVAIAGAGTDTASILLSGLGYIGFGAGLYYAFREKKAFWGYVGFGLLGGIVGSIPYNVYRNIPKPKK